MGSLDGEGAVGRLPQVDPETSAVRTALPVCVSRTTTCVCRSVASTLFVSHQVSGPWTRNGRQGQRLCCQYATGSLSGRILEPEMLFGILTLMTDGSVDAAPLELIGWGSRLTNLGHIRIR